MNVTREAKMNEAIRRMKKLGLFPQYISSFQRTGKVQVSEPPIGALFFVEDELQKQIDEFEKSHNALVYIVVRAYTEFGKMDSLIYVSDHQDEWQYDEEDMKDGILMTYTINHDAPECSEFGSIGVRRTIAAGLIRQY